MALVHNARVGKLGESIAGHEEVSVDVQPDNGHVSEVRGQQRRRRSPGDRPLRTGQPRWAMRTPSIRADHVPHRCFWRCRKQPEDIAARFEARLAEAAVELEALRAEVRF